MFFTVVSRYLRAIRRKATDIQRCRKAMMYKPYPVATHRRIHVRQRLQVNNREKRCNVWDTRQDRSP
jgi:hypothetical protein